jgi:hypothetical protein
MANLLWLALSFNRTAFDPFSDFIELSQSLGHAISLIEAGTAENIASFDSMLTQTS